MIPTLQLSSASPSSAFFLKPSYSSYLLSLHTRLRYNNNNTQLNKFKRRRLKNGKCRAELSSEVPVAMAIGACIINSLIFPVTTSQEEIEAESFVDSADARFAVMRIISFIPYFNWMSWVFAWLDTGNRRYAVYAAVYLAPYLRSNLSISPEDSWLPVASILLCIAHIQVEASSKNGDIQGIKAFNEVLKHIKKKIGMSNQEGLGRKKIHNLQSAGENFRNEIREWAATQQDYDILNEDGEVDEDAK